MRLKYEKVIHHAIVNNLFGFGYTKKSCNAQGSSKYYLFVTAPYIVLNLHFYIDFCICHSGTSRMSHNVWMCQV